MSSQKDKYKDYTYEDFLDDDLRKEYFKHLIMKELRRKDELRECAGNRGISIIEFLKYIGLDGPKLAKLIDKNVASESKVKFWFTSDTKRRMLKQSSAGFDEVKSILEEVVSIIENSCNDANELEENTIKFYSDRLDEFRTIMSYMKGGLEEDEDEKKTSLPESFYEGLEDDRVYTFFEKKKRNKKVMEKMKKNGATEQEILDYAYESGAEEPVIESVGITDSKKKHKKKKQKKRRKK